MTVHGTTTNRTLPITMSALSFTSAIAARPVGAAKAAKASVSTKVSALGGFGPNMPADEYNKKMAAKKATIEANKAKGGAKKAQVVIEPHRHEGVFVAKGKDDALVTKNMVGRMFSRDFCEEGFHSGEEFDSAHE